MRMNERGILRVIHPPTNAVVFSSDALNKNLQVLSLNKLKLKGKKNSKLYYTHEKITKRELLTKVPGGVQKQQRANSKIQDENSFLDLVNFFQILFIFLGVGMP